MKKERKWKMSKENKKKKRKKKKKEKGPKERNGRRIKIYVKWKNK